MLLQPVLGDIFSDLPEISSFTFSESAHYKTDTAQTPYQHFLRRPPPFNESSQEARAAAAEAFMRSCCDDERKKILHGQCLLNGVEKVLSVNACLHCLTDCDTTLSVCLSVGWHLVCLS